MLSYANGVCEICSQTDDFMILMREFKSQSLT